MPPATTTVALIATRSPDTFRPPREAPSPESASQGPHQLDGPPPWEPAGPGASGPRWPAAAPGVRLRLRGKMILAVMLCVCPLIVGAVLALGYLSASILRHAMLERVETHAHSAARAIESWDDEFLQVLHHAREIPDIASMDPLRQGDALQRLGRHYPWITVLLVTGPDGRCVVRSDGREGQDYSDLRWYRTSMAGDEANRELLVARSLGRPALVVSTPIRGVDGAPVGVLSAVAELESVSRLLGERRPRDAGRHYVVDERGMVLAFPEAQTPTHKKLVDWHDRAPVRDALVGRLGAGDYVDDQGRRWLVHSERLRNGWTLVVESDAREALAPARSMIRGALAMALGTACLAALLTGIIAQRMLGPIHRLGLAAGAFARGRWDQRVEVRGHDELAALAQAFNQMAGRLERGYRDMEDQVRERTARLEELNAELEAHRLASETRARDLQALLDGLPGYATLKDNDGRYIAANALACAALALPLERVLGATDADLGLQGDTLTQVEEDRRLLRGEAEMIEREEPIEQDGRTVWVVTRKLGLRGPGGALDRVLRLSIDITARREAQQTARQLSQAVEQAPTPVVITDLQGRITFVNRAFTRVTGYGPGEVLGRNPRVLQSGTTPRGTFIDLWETLHAGREWRGEFQNRRKTGEAYWEQASIAPLLDEGGRATHYVAVKEDITDRKTMERELERAARLDKLTSLPNRALLLDRIQQSIHRHQSWPERKFAVLFLDFDRFKIVNDSLGHDAGDQLLIKIAERLRTQVSVVDSVSRVVHGDTAARLGGDEFVILLDEVRGAAEAAQRAEALLDALAAPYDLGEMRIVSTASIGVVAADSGYRRAEEILRDADTAMYEAKLAGRGRVAVFDAKMRQGVRRRMELESELRTALAQNQFVLFYQPIVSLETGALESVEALVRWRHPQRGMIAPGEFIPIAEETGLIVPLGDWVLQTAIGQMACWQAESGATPIPSVSINLSRQQLLVPGLVERICAIAREAKVDPARIHLEITESTVMRDTRAAVELLRGLRQHGFRLDLDDFGTGYSSLSCLHQFPLDTIKIDRSFVNNIGRGHDYAALIHAIVTLAGNLHIRVVGEGIETAEQMVMLQSLECQLGQGYYFGRPAPAEDVVRYRPPVPAGDAARR